MRSLIVSEQQSLRDCGRLEFGEGILPRLIYTFCDSLIVAPTITIRWNPPGFVLYLKRPRRTHGDDELMEQRKLFTARRWGRWDRKNMDTGICSARCAATIRMRRRGRRG
jgi:hypothetical protein